MRNEKIILILIISIFLIYLFAKAFCIIYPDNDFLKGFSSSMNSELVTLFMLTIYAMFTFMLFSETKLTREQQNNPKIVARLEPLGTNLTVIRIKNVGNGSAYNISLKYNILKNGQKIMENSWMHSLFQPTEFSRLIIEELGIMQFFENYDRITFELSYNNSEGRLIKENIEFDLKELLKGIKNNKWIWEHTTEEDIHSISETLKSMKKEIENISKSMGYISHEDKKKIDKEMIEKLQTKEDKNSNK